MSIRHLSFYLILEFSIIGVLGCSSPQERDVKIGLKHQANGEFREAISKFSNAMKRNPSSSIAIKAARESLKIQMFELKNYDRSIEALKFIILYSEDSEERWNSQMQIAQIYFDHLGWYDKALVEYSKLLSSNLSVQDEIKVRLAIARAYYYLGQFSQALSESGDLLKKHEISLDQEFDLLLLQANIELSLKKYSEAAKEFNIILKKFPEQSKKENIGINLALCYEELNQINDALSTLEDLKKYYEPKEYIDLRIKKIQKRIQNLPKKRVKK